MFIDIFLIFMLMRMLKNKKCNFNLFCLNLDFIRHLVV